LVTANTIFWEVDVQADFMLPEGKLYVPGAEKIIANINRLVEAVRQDRVFLISSADAHSPEDAELREWPPHCMKGGLGAELLPEARARRCLVIPNEAEFALPEDFGGAQQIILQKNQLDVFTNPHADTVLERLKEPNSTGFAANPEFVVFGVATEYCVRCAADGLLRKGRRVAIVTDAIKAIDVSKGQKVLNELASHGARLISTEEALARLSASNDAVTQGEAFKKS
jgi:nicotinamidase/pyrazinamidase